VHVGDYRRAGRHVRLYRDRRPLFIGTTRRRSTSASIAAARSRHPPWKSRCLVNTLARLSRDVANVFAGRTRCDQWPSVFHTTQPARDPSFQTGSPALTDAVVAFYCRLIEIKAGVATHNVVFAVVVAVLWGRPAAALVYHERPTSRFSRGVWRAIKREPGTRPVFRRQVPSHSAPYRGIPHELCRWNFMVFGRFMGGAYRRHQP